jgi:glucosamine-6-phosphate deaminase
MLSSVADVPTHAISMSVRQILAAREILVMVPDQRKAAAVAAVLTGPITPDVPASILRRHDNTTLYLDTASASLVDPAVLSSPPA